MRRIVLGLLLFVGCEPPPFARSCEDYDCSGHGSCITITRGTDQVPTCLCDADFSPSPSGFRCLPASTSSACAGVQCSGHGICVSARGEEQCVCADGYQQGEGDLSCLRSCAGVTCSGHGTCREDFLGGRCICYPGYSPTGDSLSCAKATSPFQISYILTSDARPDSRLGEMALDVDVDVKQNAGGKLVETMRFDIPLDSDGKGLSRQTRFQWFLDSSGIQATEVKFEDEFTQGTVKRRRSGAATFAHGNGTVIFQRLAQTVSIKFGYKGTASPIPMLGGFEYPGWTLGCFSPAFYALALKRYNVSVKGAQPLEVFWPDSGMVGQVRVESDPGWTDSKPVLFFPDYQIRVVYEGDFPEAIRLEEQAMQWSLSSGTGPELNLSPPKTPTPFVPAALPTDFIEKDGSFTSRDKTTLYGTITYPQAKEGTVPAVLMVSDLNARDRDIPFSKLAQMPLYQHLAAHLAHAGYASLRYDPRGRGESKADLNQASLSKLAEDAEAALGLLLTTPELDKDHIYLLSQGTASAVALSLLKTSSNIRGYVALAPLIKELDRALLYSSIEHLRVSGCSASFIDMQRKLLSGTLQQLSKGTFSGMEWRGLPVSFLQQLLAFDGSESLASFLGPVLVMRGDQDLEIPLAQLQAAEAAASKTNKVNFSSKTLIGLTYSFSEGSMTDLWEGAFFPLQLPTLTLQTLLDWLSKN